MIKQPIHDNWSVRAVGDLSEVSSHLRDAVIPAKVPGCVHTDLLRAGKIPEAMRLEAQKGELSGRYMVAVESLKNAQKYLTQVSPELLTTLRRHHDTFRAMLQINLTVLATAHAVSEGIVRGVNTEIQRRNIPSTYTAAGQRAVPGPRHIKPLSVSRSL